MQWPPATELLNASRDDVRTRGIAGCFYPWDTSLFGMNSAVHRAVRVRCMMPKGERSHVTDTNPRHPDRLCALDRALPERVQPRYQFIILDETRPDDCGDYRTGDGRHGNGLGNDRARVRSGRDRRAERCNDSGIERRR